MSGSFLPEDMQTTSRVTSSSSLRSLSPEVSPVSVPAVSLPEALLSEAAELPPELSEQEAKTVAAVRADKISARVLFFMIPILSMSGYRFKWIKRVR